MDRLDGCFQGWDRKFRLEDDLGDVTHHKGLHDRLQIANGLGSYSLYRS